MAENLPNVPSPLTKQKKKKKKKIHTQKKNNKKTNKQKKNKQQQKKKKKKIASRVTLTSLKSSLCNLFISDTLPL